MLISSVSSGSSSPRNASPRPLLFGMQRCCPTLTQQCDNLSIQAERHINKHPKKYLTLASLTGGALTGLGVSYLKSTCASDFPISIPLCLSSILGTFGAAALTVTSVVGWGVLLYNKALPADDIDDDETVVSVPAGGNMPNVPVDPELGLQNNQLANHVALPNEEEFEDVPIG